MDTCVKKGGRLITLTTLDKFLSMSKYMELYRDQLYSEYQVGAFSSLFKFQWLWANQSKVPYDVLSLMIVKYGHCGVLRRSGGKWALAAADCYMKLNHLCSKKESKYLSNITYSRS